MGASKVLIAVPVHSTVTADTADSLMRLVRETVCPTDQVFVRGSLVVENRIAAVRIAQQRHVSHLFFIDSDISCAGDTLNRLLAHDKAVVAAAYRMRVAPHRYNIRNKDMISPASLPEGLHEVYGIAAGCMLIDMSVFAIIKRPWFGLLSTDMGLVTVSEDMWFCMQCHDANIPVYCDPSIPVGHVGECIY